MSPAMINSAMLKIVTDAALRRMESSALARWWRRSFAARPVSGRLRLSLLAVAVARLIVRCAAARTITAISSTNPMRRASFEGPAR